MALPSQPTLANRWIALIEHHGTQHAAIRAYLDGKLSNDDMLAMEFSLNDHALATYRLAWVIEKASRGYIVRNP